MNNELTANNCTELTDANPSPTLTQINIGSGNTIDNIIGHQTIYNIGESPSLSTPNNSFCNIIVLRGNTYSHDCFLILKRKAQIAGINLADLYTYPTLFIKVNCGYLKCLNENQEFYYGRVIEVVEENLHYNVRYVKRPTIALLQQRLIDVAVRLKITPQKGTDILDETGWRIYPLNIYKELTDSGFDLNNY